MSKCNFIYSCQRIYDFEMFWIQTKNVPHSTYIFEMDFGFARFVMLDGIFALIRFSCYGISSFQLLCVCVSVYLDYHCQYMNFISFAFLTIFYWHSEEQMWNQIAHQSSASIDAWSDCDNLGMCMVNISVFKIRSCSALSC